MRTAAEMAPNGTSPQDRTPQGSGSQTLLKEVVAWLDEAKAEDIVSIDLAGKSSLGDYMIIATGRTDRHVGGIADQLRKKLKEAGVEGVRVEGMETCDWVIADAGDIIVHIFRQEVRDFYKLEKMWSADRPGETAH